MASRFIRMFTRQSEDQSVAIEAALLRSDRFRLEREAEWQRLDRIVTAIEKGRMRRLPDEDVLDLPALYRTAASSLAIARETSLDLDTLSYLEALVQRAWFQVYGPRSSLGGWLRRFFAGGWGAAVRAIWLDLCIALAAMIAGTAVGWLLVARDPQWYHALVPGEHGDARQPGASVAQLRETIFGAPQQSEGLSVFAAYLFSNNAQVAILAFALGFAFGIPSILLLVQNTVMLGAMLWLFHEAGLGLDFAGWLSVHGTTELLAILLAGAAGIHVGRSIAFPGDRPVLASAAQSGQRAAVVMTGVVFMLIVAAVLEGFVRQLVNETPGRFIIGGTMLAGWLAYFLAYRPVATGAPE
jgi:uncharacterized membrane protein SpoIIM required for sporulation